MQKDLLENFWILTHTHTYIQCAFEWFQHGFSRSIWKTKHLCYPVTTVPVPYHCKYHISVKGNHHLLCSSRYHIKINVSYLIATTACSFWILYSLAAVKFCHLEFCQLEPPDEHTWHPNWVFLTGTFILCPPRRAFPFPRWGALCAPA